MHQYVFEEFVLRVRRKRSRATRTAIDARNCVWHVFSLRQRGNTRTTKHPCTAPRKGSLVPTGQRRGSGHRRPNQAQQLLTATQLQDRTSGDKTKLLINAIAFRIIAIGVKHDRRAIDRE